MESELKNQNDLLQQLKLLRAEKELLEKHVFVLNECLSVEELKAKISNLEKKKEMLVSLENMIGRLRTEIEPINYLKSVLENKLLIENQLTNKIESRIDSKPGIPKFDRGFFNPSAGCKTLQSQTTNIPNDSTKTDLVSSQKFYDEVLGAIQTQSNSVSNDGSVDELMQLLDQYDVVSDHDILNFPEENNSKTLKTQKLFCLNQEPTKSNLGAIDNEIHDKQTATTSTYFDAEGINVQLKNEDNLSVKGSMESSGIIDDHGSQLYKASTSQSFTNQGSLDSSVNIQDLLLRIPHMLLQQGISSIKAEEKANVPLKSVNDNTNTSLEDDKVTKYSETPDKEDQLKTLKKETDNKSTKQTELSQCSISSNARNSETNIISFNGMNLKIDILRGIYSLGFVNPTALQQRVVVHCVNGQDVIVFAGPGNGRTMMFTIPLLQRIETSLNECQALVLVPTRDLAVHIQKIIMSVGDFLGVNVCIGGDNVPRKLSVIPHVVVGTPAGVSSMITYKSLRIDCIQTVVLDKTEKMLTTNYTKLIEEIMGKLVNNKQVTLLASDKLNHVLDLYMDTLRDPLVIINEDNKEKENEILKSLPKQFFLNIQEEWKMNALCEVIETLKIQRAIIFCNTLDRAQKLCESLQRLEYAVSPFYLEISAREREQKLDMFSSKNLRMLITTEPIKGSQFHQAAWIINYDLPINHIIYLDRVIKCAENVKVLNLVNENDDSTKLAIEKHNKSYMIQMPMNMIDLLQY